MEKETDQIKRNWKKHKYFSIVSISFSTIAVIALLIFPFAAYSSQGMLTVIVDVSIWGGFPPTRAFLVVILFSFLCCVLLSILWLLLSVKKIHLKQSIINSLKIGLVISSYNSLVITVIFASIVHLFSTGERTYYWFGSLHTSIICSFFLFLVSLIQFKYPIITIRTEPILENKNLSNNALSKF
ncbi:MAG: hypothetical protein HZR80_18780 [Candidatus Heimdallarchaeota archaeon]